MIESFEGFPVTKHGAVVELSISLNTMNQFTENAFLNFERSLDAIRELKDYSVLMLTGSSEGAFSAGLDPAQLVGKRHDEVHRTVDILNRCTYALFDFPLPVVAVLSGHAMGGGALFAIFSDFRLMAEKKARIGFPEVGLSMCLGASPTLVLEQLVGYRIARDLLYKGTALKADEALQIGLIDEVYSNESLYDKALAYCKNLAKTPRPALKAIKRGIRQPTKDKMKSFETLDRDLLVRTILTAEAQEGFTALLERRRPDFDNVSNKT